MLSCSLYTVTPQPQTVKEVITLHKNDRKTLKVNVHSVIILLNSFKLHLFSVKINAPEPASKLTHLHKHRLTFDAALIEADQN